MNTTIRRLMKEAHELSPSAPRPSPYFTAAPLADNVLDWHFTLAGPPASPYAGGIYHGRIVLPPTYPLRPPSFRFLTPSGRFEINREICLSISGHHEESWQPAWGIRTALVALRSFMDAETAGQVGGIEAREEVRRDWARRSRGWTCECCGRCNEEILGEWSAICREKGIVDEEQQLAESEFGSDHTTPAELAIGVKNAGAPGMVKHAPAAASPTADLTAATPPTTTTMATTTTTELSAHPPDRSSAAAQPLTPTPTTTTTTTTPAANSESHSPPASAPGPTPTPTFAPSESSATSAPAPEARTRPVVPQSRAPVRETEDPWLDLAIMGVLFALVVMVMKKLFLSGDDLQ